MTKLTTDNYKCTCCSKIAPLVMVRGRAWLCKNCYDKLLKMRRAKRRALRAINQMAIEELGS